jgi:DNA ligase-associated metallophosphoesterase
LPERAIYWPRERTLIVADLHWGKSETFAALGVPIALGQTDDELARLDTALRRTGAKRLLVLGDLIHGPHSLAPHIVARIGAWRATHDVSLTLVAGNHDRWAAELPEPWRIDARIACEERGPFRFCHHPEPDPGHYVFAGHLHPTVRLEGGGDVLRLPCFYLGADVGVLPAFNAFTNGVVMSFDAGARVFAIADGTVVPLT